jgi:hypothetical protein
MRLYEMAAHPVIEHYEQDENGEVTGTGELVQIALVVGDEVVSELAVSSN